MNKNVRILIDYVNSHALDLMNLSSHAFPFKNFAIQTEIKSL